MRSLGGIVLLAGLGVGLFVYLPAPVDRETSLDRVERLAAEHAAQGTTAALPALRSRTFSPNVSLAAITAHGSRAKAQPAAVVAGRGAVYGPPRQGLLEPSTPDSRYKLIVDLQTKLKSLGCYYGRIDGSWGMGSKYAMQSFMDHVNAALPIDTPNYVLLQLVEAHSGKVCGVQRDDVQITGTQIQTQPWQVTTAAPTQPAVQPLFKPVPNSVITSEPLPGRMAIGGPDALPPVDSVYAPAANGAASGFAAAAIAPDGSPIAPPVAEPSEPKKRVSQKRSRRRDGPGTPRYNLMLSLGGVY